MNVPDYKYQTTLIIDDNELDLLVNEMILSTSGFTRTVIPFRSAREALRQLQEDKILPDYIFVDINMPLMTGFEFLACFEKLPEHVTDRCKIVVISSSDEDKDLKKAKSFKSVVTYLVKPLEFDKLHEL
jgi:CheY-like chemotaxis protein